MKKRSFILTVILLSLPSSLSHAGPNHYVYGIKTDFMMSEQDAIFKDIYVNMGTSQGVKEGTILEVYRTISTTDEVNKKVAQKLSFKIARVRVIHAEDDVAVARMLEMRPAKDTPLGDIPTVVVGDLVEVARK